MARKQKTLPPVEQAEQVIPVEQVEIIDQDSQVVQVVQVTNARKVVKTKRTGVGAFIIGILKDAKENKQAMTHDEILKQVKEKFGDEVKTTKACISWYASKINGGYI